MTTFAYVVKDRAGATHRGTIESETRNTLVEQLWKQGFVVLSVDEQKKHKISLRQLGQPRVKADHLVVFSRQLATMVESGIPIISALDVLTDQIKDRTFQDILKRMRNDVEAGASLSEASAKHPNAFSELFINMVRAGESSGRLDEILDRLAGYMEKASVLQRKVKSSLVYPAFVSVLAFGITTFLLVVIVPKFKDIFTSLGGQLPLPTQILLSISEFMQRFLVIEVISGIALLTLLRLYIQTPAGRFRFDQCVLKVPIMGVLLQKVVIAQFARTLATLVKSGVPILTSLDIVSKTAGNKVIEAAIKTARSSIKEGENIADPLTNSKVFPSMVTRMISVGEKTGELEKMLTKIADFYENEVDAAVTGLTSLIEPLVIAVLGVLIGGIVISLFLPVFQISQLVSK